jgi:membrane-associated phospholipid phosphatase
VTEQSYAYRVFQPPGFTNQYAALPSLHFGWDLLVGLAIAAAATHWWLRLIGYVLPALMAVAVVTTANHFVVDVVAGGALALVGLAAARWREARRRPPPPPLPRQTRPRDTERSTGGSPSTTTRGAARPLRARPFAR